MTLPVAIAIMAKAPVAGLAKTRLIPALGAVGAARLQRRLTLQVVHTAQQANLGPVTLFCAPDISHRFFRAVHARTGVAVVAQHTGDLGQRMHAAVELLAPTLPTACGSLPPEGAVPCLGRPGAAAAGPVLVVGTDCPALTPSDLQAAAQQLQAGQDVVVQPAEDGGYVLIGLRAPCWPVFDGVAWSTDQVMPHTRARLAAQGLRWCEAPTLWDVDVPADLPRLRTLPGW